MLFEKRPTEQTIVRLYCPVCSTFLGEKMKTEIKEFHCKECKAMFYFYPGGKKPRAHLDSSRPEPCNCGRCGR